MCTRPIRGHRLPDGRVVFNAPHGATGDKMAVKCGRCMECRVARASDWTTRLICEQQMHPSSCFLTLTYNDENLPIDLSLDSTHPIGFLRKLRDYYRHKDGRRIRYYHCGEYGEESDRPHYHFILFNVDFHEDRVFYKHTKYGPLFTSPTVERLWGRGFAPFGAVTPQSCRYVAGYIQKKLYGDMAATEYATLWHPDMQTGEMVPQMWRKPPYSTMSLKPGIGRPWIERYGKDVYAYDNVIVDGNSRMPPAFFDNWLAERDPAKLDEFKAARAAKAPKLLQNLDTPEWTEAGQQRMMQREAVHNYRNAKQTREFTQEPTHVTSPPGNGHG